MMLRKSMWISLVFLVVFMPANLLAQEMMYGKWWHDRALIKELGLTKSERQTLDDKYTESRRKMIDLKNEMEKQRFELDLLLGAQDADKQKIMGRYDSLEQSRAKLSRARFEMLMDVRDTLGAERFEELKAMQRYRDRRDAKRFLKKRYSQGNRARDRDRDRD